jgi:hypothetical protein
MPAMRPRIGARKTPQRVVSWIVRPAVDEAIRIPVIRRRRPIREAGHHAGQEKDGCSDGKKCAASISEDEQDRRDRDCEQYTPWRSERHRLPTLDRRRPSATVPASLPRFWSSALSWLKGAPARRGRSRELRREAGDEEDERDDDRYEDAEPQRQPAHRDQRRRLRLALAEFLHEAMRFLARVRREPLRLLAELRVHVVVGVARGRAPARRPVRIVRPFTVFIHGLSFAAIPFVRLVRPLPGRRSFERPP